MKTLNLTKRWHILFIGANGHITNGIEVTSLRDQNWDKRNGYQHTWNINDIEFIEKKASVIDRPDLTEEDYQMLLDELNALSLEQRNERN